MIDLVKLGDKTYCIKNPVNVINIGTHIINKDLNIHIKNISFPDII